MISFAGQITDYDTGAGVPAATVEAWVGNLLLTRSAADANGYFSIASNSTPDTVKITSVGYGSVSYPFSPMFSNPSTDTDIPLQKAVKEEGNVTVTAHKISPVMWFGLGALVLILMSKKR